MKNKKLEDIERCSVKLKEIVYAARPTPQIWGTGVIAFQTDDLLQPNANSLLLANKI